MFTNYMDKTNVGTEELYLPSGYLGGPKQPCMSTFRMKNSTKWWVGGQTSIFWTSSCPRH